MRKWIVTVAGAGLLPGGPGTWGSLATSLFLMAVYLGLDAAGATGWIWQIALIAGLFITSALCVALGPWAVAHFGKKDPGQVVIDEAAGICLSMLFLPVYPGWREAWAIAAAFVAFRIFDITKPPPARQLEKLPMGWGILLDDLAAAVYANLLCQFFLRIVLPRMMAP